MQSCFYVAFCVGASSPKAWEEGPNLNVGLQTATNNATLMIHFTYMFQYQGLSAVHSNLQAHSYEKEPTLML